MAPDWSTIFNVKSDVPKQVGSRRIVGVDLMESKYAAAKAMGADECVNGAGDVKSALLAMEKWGFDYTFDCTGKKSRDIAKLAKNYHV